MALVAPAGPLREEKELERAADNTRSLGWEPVPGRHVLARTRYLAGTDEERVGDLNAAIGDPAIDGIWCVRGGYGVARTLALLDYATLAARPKAILGYSDITALHCALRARTGVVSFHAPTARTELTALSRRSLERAVCGDGEPCGDAPAARILRRGVARGPLVGGNLALITSLLGTPYSLDARGAILVLEDVKENVYRIDRMLTQLRLAGVLETCAGLMFGSFTERGDGEDDDDAALDALLEESAGWVNGPVLAGVPVGHIEDQWTLPLGAPAELDAETPALRVAPAHSA